MTESLDKGRRFNFDIIILYALVCCIGFIAGVFVVTPLDDTEPDILVQGLGGAHGLIFAWWACYAGSKVLMGKPDASKELFSGFLSVAIAALVMFLGMPYIYPDSTGTEAALAMLVYITIFYGILKKLFA